MAPEKRKARLVFLIVAGALSFVPEIRSQDPTPPLRTQGQPGVTIEEVMEAAPDVMLVAPCGYTADQAAKEFRDMELPSDWQNVPAVRNSQIYALEANSYFSRPGPRLVTGIEILAKLFHPAVEVSPEAEHAATPMRGSARTASASA